MTHGIKVLHRSANTTPKVSLVLLDWSCRESFHIFHYLRRQSVPRADFEVIWVEIYDTKPREIAELAAEARAQDPGILDQWIVMNVDRESYYHKHAAYNVGIAAARGDIVCIMDSDAFMGEGFIAAILAAFEANPDIALHIDEVRNVNRAFYPFSYPSIADVLKADCINWLGQSTRGVLDDKTPLYTRNYGACLCARRDAVIAIGGADEHLDYMGHVCGPYDLTFRLVNAGKREVWHPTEFIYHCWHPGTDGENNFIGPHDGRNNSTRALKARDTGRVMPYLENQGIRELRQQPGQQPAFEALAQLLLPQEQTESWRFTKEKSLLSQCRQAYYASRWTEAIRLYGQMEEKPAQADFLAEMGRAHHICGRPKEASALLQRALQLDPENRLAAAAIGWLLHSMGDSEGAIPWFDASIEGKTLFVPDIFIEALRGRAWALLCADRNRDAAQDFLRAIDLTPGHNHELLAELREGLGKATARLTGASRLRTLARKVKRRLKRAILGNAAMAASEQFMRSAAQAMRQDLPPELWREHRFGLSRPRWASLSGRAFWVTGAGTGYGRAIAVALALAGATVYISGRRAEKLAECVREAEALANRQLALVPLPLDVTDAEALRKAAALVRASSPQLHGVVHSAGLPQPGQPHPLLEMDLGQWEALQGTNVTACWLLTREAADMLVASHGGRVLFLGSEAGWASSVGHGPYNVSKAALNSLAASMAAEFALRHPEADMQLNVLVPGEARTEMNQGSSTSPFSIVSMALLLLSCGRGGPNGKIFHRDGRHMTFAYNTAFTGSVVD